ncbi:MAG: aldolase/citrate lyase family protein [Actinomycetia bacterium]|nr:aldolase/citrate lyase family protein [Actinomycetes bacterium]
MVGPADLAISMGYMHDRTNSRVLDTTQSVLDRCREAGVPFGFFAATVDDGLHWMDRGGQILTCTSDTAFVAQGVAQMSARFAAARGR